MTYLWHISDALWTYKPQRYLDIHDAHCSITVIKKLTRWFLMFCCYNKAQPLGKWILSHNSTQINVKTFHNTIGIDLESQHLGVWARRIMSLKPAWTMWWDPDSTEQSLIVGDLRENGLDLWRTPAAVTEETFPCTCRLETPVPCDVRRAQGGGLLWESAQGEQPVAPQERREVVEAGGRRCPVVSVLSWKKQKANKIQLLLLLQIEC